jgi:sugar phosphate isomerase/epimerase
MKNFIICLIMLFAVACQPGANKNSTQKGTGDIVIGVIINGITDVEKQLVDLHQLGFGACQFGYDENYDQATADRLKKAAKENNIKVTALVAVPAGAVWTFSDGPSTIGLVPRETRQARVEFFKKAIDFCVMADIPALHSHFGFIPEDPKNELYGEFITVMRDLANYAKERGINIYCETGQETPITLVRAIKDVGTGNVFINCDLANLVMYGNANSLDAVKMFGSLIKEFHAKDGLYPNPADPYSLGKEVNIPEGEVNFPAVIKELKKQNFKGAMIIEHEFGDNQRDYFIQTKKYLEDLINK